MKLKGKVAIITGAGRGIGREIARGYAGEGADLALFARTSLEIERLASEVKAQGRRAIAITGDIRVEQDVKNLVQKALGEFGKIDIMVNNAGINFGKAVKPLVKDMTLEDFQEVISTNLFGTFLGCREVLASMMERKSGVIINVLGMGSLDSKGSPGYSAYNCSKAAIERFTTVLAREVESFDIRVYSLHPGGGYNTSFSRSPATTRSDKMDPVIVRPLAIFLASDEPARPTGKTFSVPEWNREHGFPVF